MSRAATTAVSLDSAAATVVRSARRSGGRVEVRGCDGRRLGVIISAAELESLEAIEDARDMADVRAILAEMEETGDDGEPWEAAKARLALLP